MEQATGESRIETPDLPVAAWHLWEWFWDLHQSRGGGFGPAPLSYAELDAWARTQLTRPHCWELEALRKMDRAYLRAAAKVAEAESKGKKGKGNGRPR